MKIYKVSAEDGPVFGLGLGAREISQTRRLLSALHTAWFRLHPRSDAEGVAIARKIGSARAGLANWEIEFPRQPTALLGGDVPQVWAAMSTIQLRQPSELVRLAETQVVYRLADVALGPEGNAVFLQETSFDIRPATLEDWHS
jgi:hypothetical protein